MDTSANEYLKGAIEALLFISEKPVALEQIAEVMEEGVGAVDVRKLIEDLREEYDTKQRGMVIVEIAGGYQMLSSSHYVSFVRNFLKTKVKEKLSRPSLETLAIVAYKQPVSRGDIELVRGVNSDGVVLHLLNKGLIKIVGKKDVAGRPFLYGTSKLFLEYFGLKSLRDLPKLEDVSLLLANSQESSQPLEGMSQEESALAASLALDEAEAKVAEDSPAADSVSPETEKVSSQIEEHLKAARENVAEILSDHEVKEEKMTPPEEPDALKEAMDGIYRADIQQEEKSSRIDAIVNEEAASREDNVAEEKP